MPVPTELTVKASEVRKGDIYQGFEVASVDRAVKWVTIHLVGGGLNKARLDDDRVVTRQIRTEVEKRQEKLEFFVQDVEQGIRRATEGVTAAIAKMTEYAQYGSESQWSALDAYAKAVCANEIWQYVVKVHENLADTGKLDPQTVDNETFPMAWVNAVNVTAGELTENVMSNRYRSNSTSWTSNGMAEQMRDSVCSWLRSSSVHFAAKLAEGK